MLNPLAAELLPLIVETPGITISMLADRIGTRWNPNLSRSLAELSRAGCIKREIDENDFRLVHFTATAAGKRIAKAIKTADRAMKGRTAA